MRWRPREDEEQQAADDPTKVSEDPSEDWCLHPEIYEAITALSCLGGRKPTLVVFASATNTKVPNSFFALHLGPGCKGVNAFAQQWACDKLTGARHLEFVLGPFKGMGKNSEGHHGSESGRNHRGPRVAQAVSARQPCGGIYQ